MGLRKYVCGTFLLIVFLTGCIRDQNDPQYIIDRAIEEHGGDAFNHSFISFDFRDRRYTTRRVDGVFTHTREWTDSLGEVRDVLSNDGFERYVNERKVDLPEERKQAFTRSIDGVIYFALLPFRLNDPAVVKEYVGETQMEGQDYALIRVTFQKEGGGVDYDDVFLYWINRESYRMDYFAYSYISDGGGIRFRKATKGQSSNGILVQDYINYKPAGEGVSIDEIEEMFKNGKLEELSEIDHENLTVEILPR